MRWQLERVPYLLLPSAWLWLMWLARRARRAAVWLVLASRRWWEPKDPQLWGGQEVVQL